MTRTRMAAAFAVLATLAVAGCGPATKLDVGSSNIHLALSLGEEAAVQVAPVGPISKPIPPAVTPFLPTGPVGDGGGSGSPTSTSTPAPTVSTPPIRILPCPAVSAITPALSNPPSPSTAPANGTYKYRAKAKNVDGSSTQNYRGNSTWKVTTKKVAGIAGAYDITTVVKLGKVKTTRVFRVLTQPISSALSDSSVTTGVEELVISEYDTEAKALGLPIVTETPSLAVYGQAGIYLVSQTSGNSTFTPTEPIPLVQTPTSLGSTFEAIGTNGTTDMAFTSTVVGTGNVNACGTKVDASEVKLTNGTIATGGAGGQVSDVSFSETLEFGMAFGGLPVGDKGTVSGSGIPGGTISRSFQYTINSVPKTKS